MTNKTTTSPEGNIFLERVFMLLVFMMVGIVVWATIVDKERSRLRQEREQAWVAAVESAPSPQHRQLMMYLAKEIPGCRAPVSIDPDRLRFKIEKELTPSKVRELRLPVLLAHEQYCLEAIQGQALAFTVQGTELLSEVEIPR